MGDVGYQDVTVSKVIGPRSLAATRRHRHGNMIRSGLSAWSIRERFLDHMKRINGRFSNRER